MLVVRQTGMKVLATPLTRDLKHALLTSPCCLQLLPALLNADGLSNVVNITLSQGWLPEGVTTNFLQTSASSTPGSTDLLLVKVELLDGAGHVTWINVKDACLDLRVLPKLAAKLPYLQEFRCVSCNRCAATLPPEARMLPEKLHQAALPRMTSLELSQTNVTGTLPKWENWTTIEVSRSSRDAPACSVRLSTTARAVGGSLRCHCSTAALMFSLACLLACLTMPRSARSAWQCLHPSACSALRTRCKAALPWPQPQGHVAVPCCCFPSVELQALKLSALPPAPDQPGLRLTGRLPPAWGSMSSLQVLQLSNQQLTGGLPPAWGLGPLAGNLTQLWLAGNGNITGQVRAAH